MIAFGNAGTDDQEGFLIETGKAEITDDLAVMFQHRR